VEVLGHITTQQLMRLCRVVLYSRTHTHTHIRTLTNTQYGVEQVEALGRGTPQQLMRLCQDQHSAAAAGGRAGGASSVVAACALVCGTDSGTSKGQLSLGASSKHAQASRADMATAALQGAPFLADLAKW
jgi:hypothetical protein